MEKIENYFFRDMGVLFGRSIRHILHRSNTMIIIVPLVCMLLFVYLFSAAILILDIITHKKENKWKR
jgi:ABC-2 type transport system permease protein